MNRSSRCKNFVSADVSIWSKVTKIIIGASVARPSLGVERQLFYIFILYNIIWCRGPPGYRDILREGVAAEEGVAQCCDHYLLRTVARYAEVHSALQPAGEAAPL